MDCEGEQVQGDQNGREVLFSGIMAAVTLPSMLRFPHSQDQSLTHRLSFHDCQ